MLLSIQKILPNSTFDVDQLPQDEILKILNFGPFFFKYTIHPSTSKTHLINYMYFNNCKKNKYEIKF